MKTKLRWIVPFLSLIAVHVASATPLSRTQMRAIKTAYARQDKAFLTKNTEAYLALIDINFQRRSVFNGGQLMESVQAVKRSANIRKPLFGRSSLSMPFAQL